MIYLREWEITSQDSFIMNHDKENLSFKIREIKRDDLDEVYQMLLDLIKHDKLEDRFKISEKSLADYLFAKNPDWFCLVAQDLNTCVDLGMWP